MGPSDQRKVVAEIGLMLCIVCEPAIIEAETVGIEVAEERKRRVAQRLPAENNSELDGGTAPPKLSRLNNFCSAKTVVEAELIH